MQPEPKTLTEALEAIADLEYEIGILEASLAEARDELERVSGELELAEEALMEYETEALGL